MLTPGPRPPSSAVAPPPPEYSSPPTLPWSPGDVRASIPPRHPLLVIADRPQVTPERPLGGFAVLKRAAGLVRAGDGPWPGPSGRGSAPPGRLPVVVVVLGAWGGVGTSTLALDLAWRCARRSEKQVVLIDADEERPSLDLLLGAATMEEELWPSARLDHVLLRLPDLASGSVSLERLLWIGASGGFRALLGRTPSREPIPVGVEHLDYLYRYHLRPSFRTVVVDGGMGGRELSTSARFYASVADWVVLVTHEGDSCLRSCLLLLEQVLAVPGRRQLALVVSGVGGDAVGPALGLVERSVAVRLRRPWVPTSAQLATRRHQPLAEVDRKVLAALDQVLSAVSTPGGDPE
jgi:hypothetical protein